MKYNQSQEYIVNLILLRTENKKIVATIVNQNKLFFYIIL